MSKAKHRRLTAEDMKKIQLGNERESYSTFVETGTYRAETTIVMSSVFSKVYSIELSKGLYLEAFDRCAEHKNVHLIYGNSVEVLPSLDIDYPTVFFLDAHACKTKPLVTAHTFPLWEELDFICKRPYADILIIDDVPIFGKKNKRANEPRWAEVTFETINEHVRKYKLIQKTVEFKGTYVVYV